MKISFNNNFSTVHPLVMNSDSFKNSFSKKQLMLVTKIKNLIKAVYKNAYYEIVYLSDKISIHVDTLSASTIDPKINEKYYKLRSLIPECFVTNQGIVYHIKKENENV